MECAPSHPACGRQNWKHPSVLWLGRLQASLRWRAQVFVPGGLRSKALGDLGKTFDRSLLGHLEHDSHLL